MEYLNSLLVAVNQRYHDNLGIEHKFNKVRNALEAGINAGMPYIEPNANELSQCLASIVRTCTVLVVVQARSEDWEEPDIQSL
jgi:hypothetical protein